MLMVGTKRDMLTIVERGPEQGEKTVWRCVCDCGEEVIASTNKLIKYAGRLSCGCHLYIPSEDMIGYKNGKLEVVAHIKREQWLCKCECGTQLTLTTANIKNRVSCGCSKEVEDLSGSTIGNWKVIRAAGKNKHGRSTFECLCMHCKTTYRIIAVSELDEERVRYSCGCTRSEAAAHLKVPMLGKVFGNLTVVKETRAKTKTNGSRYLCICSCGKHIDVLGTNLRNGKISHCGCLKPAKVYKPKYTPKPKPPKAKPSRVGEVIGNLTIVSETKGLNFKDRLYKCVCSCGSIKTYKYSQLLGSRKDCGCYAIAHFDRSRLDLTGKEYGKLIVVRKGESIIDYRGAKQTTWECKCECGNSKIIRTDILRRGYTYSCGCVLSIKDKDKLKVWPKKVRSKDSLRDSDEFKAWRLAVYKRDKYTCDCCTTRKATINAHHLEDFESNPELRLAVSNGVTLCTDCHTLFHRTYGYFGRTYRWQYEEMKQSLI